ncbi:MAG: hypothetical protein M0R30_12015 [Methanoregula sp.]|uniref:hypothetical protein n=1 Tax=Methanoregula sp. TaxID=2052170 RepID=UPI0025DCC4E9|nr:hypothetical protein [Methanoregula sp.]MCK9632348.1 hypothetical protein [Methanoregula sp.]
MPRSPGPVLNVVVLLILVLIAAAGCTAPDQDAGSTQASPAITAATLQTIITPENTPLPTTPVPAITEMTTSALPATTTVATTVPTPTPTLTQISDAALSARIVDARNKLEMFIDSNVADTVITHPDGTQDCEVKKSKELGYLIDVTTGESTFVKGDYWSIDGDLFAKNMKKDRPYIIIHTHPRMWVTCRGSGVISLYSFSIGDLEATANMTERGYHVKQLIAISDREYRIWPGQDDGWKSDDEIQEAVRRIEAQVGRPFSYYDPLLEHTFYDVDNLMPFLSEELGYHYTANNVVIS